MVVVKAIHSAPLIVSEREENERTVLVIDMLYHALFAYERSRCVLCDTRQVKSRAELSSNPPIIFFFSSSSLLFPSSIHPIFTLPQHSAGLCILFDHIGQQSLPLSCTYSIESKKRFVPNFSPNVSRRTNQECLPPPQIRFSLTLKSYFTIL